MEHIRNFVIIAHIDHGKSTLADRFLELTGTVERRKMREQYLDMHPLERERGITIKMQPVRMQWEDRGARYILNLIDTPGHADFSYEVSRALAAVEGAILLVDATQGVQAQTLANLHLAQKEGLVVIPAVNKIDLPSADAEKTIGEMCGLLGCAPDEIYRISAKEGTGVAGLLHAVVARVPPPHVEVAAPQGALRALTFDSKYDPYLGVVAHIRVVDGALRKGDKIYFIATGSTSDAIETGVFLPERTFVPELKTGEIGYVATGIKQPRNVRVGDTITRPGDISKLQNIEALPGYRDSIPVVFASLFPENQDEYEVLREALEKLRLEDAALEFSPEDAGALGRGFRAGFLGLLHMEIVAERLRREYGLALALSRPSVAFQVRMKPGDQALVRVYAASRLPDPHEIDEIYEPWARLEVVSPTAYLGALASLIVSRQGTIVETETIGPDRIRIKCEAPLREIIVDFYDKLKSISQGFASFSYSLIGERLGDLVRLDIVIAGEIHPALAEVVPRSVSYEVGRARITALKELLPRELFPIALQAAIEGRIIARETIPALKKDVTGYLYGGDRTRKMKLWKKQQRGKKRLKETGKVTIPPEVFFKLHRRA